MSEEKLRISVKDFGPLTDGSISFKPLTILIGPNNSGKSYFSMLVHTVFKAFNLKESLKNDFTFAPLNKFRYYKNLKYTAEIQDQFLGFKDKIKNLATGDEFDIPKSFIDLMTREFLVEENLTRQLGYSYACHPSQLSRNYKKNFSVKVEMGASGVDFDLEEKDIKIKKHFQSTSRIRLRAVDSGSCADDFHAIKEDGVSLLLVGTERVEDEDFGNAFLARVLRALHRQIEEELAGFFGPCYYLPAERSGFLQAHKILVSNIVKSASSPWGNTPRLSGIVSDFLSSLIVLPEDRSPFFDFIRDFEKELIDGEVAFKADSDYLHPEIRFRHRNKDIPLHLSSSTVSELAPLFLYLKYTIMPGDMLIIEEPESHLHPKNQRVLAKLLVRLLRRGVRLFVTTHSDYLLEQLSNYVVLSQVEDKGNRDEVDLYKDDYVKPNEIGVYVFEPDKKKRGFKIEEVDVSGEDGISQDEFLKVNEALYEESIKIQEKIQSDK